MPDSYLVYRALFPPFYSARSDRDTGDVDIDRHFFTLRLPQTRVFGPMWSFGMGVREVDELRQLPGMDPADSSAVSTALRALYQMQDPVRLGAVKRFHTPVFLRANVDSFLQPIDQELHESRMSLLALDTIRRTSIDGDSLKKVSPFDLPVMKGSRPIVDPEDYPSICASPSIVVSPFGSPPPPETAGAPSDRGQYLPAMQLMHGAIRFKPHPFYLSTVRKQMGLGAPAAAPSRTPEANERLGTIVLLPDGFCVAGSVRLPWLDPADAVTGWFKATFRHAGLGERVQRVLKLWFDPLDPAHPPMLAEWRGHLAQLERLLRAGRGARSGSRWIDFGPRAALTPDQLYWPETGAAEVPLFSRLDGGSRVSIDSAALALRIADPQRAADPTAVLTIEPDRFELGRVDTRLTVTGQAGRLAHTDAETVTARYRFAPGTVAESLTLVAGGDPARPVILAAPLIETAELVRRASGLPRPAPDDPALDLLWTFSPLADGWLHWPIPNATEAALARLAPPPAPGTGQEAPSAGDGISGALAFGNLAGQSGFRPSVRGWSFSVSDVRQARIDLSLDTAAARFGALVDAAADLTGVDLAFDGFASITPFRQTPQRLLPDHAERALRRVGLMAVSPSSLCGIEADLWHANGKQLNLRFEVKLSGFAIEAGDDGKARIAGGARVAWTTAIGGVALPHCADAMQPWIWKAHPALPTVQTLARALAGLARALPSGGRALAPLRLRDTPGNAMLVYSAPLDMSTSGMAIAVADTDSAASGARAGFVHPNGDSLWRDEIGMAVTTMASLTLFAGIPAPARPKPRGDDAPAPGEIELGARWADLDTRVFAELRHDIALRDEHNAFARAPGPTPAASAAPATPAAPGAAAAPQAEPATDPEFSPLPGNGPLAALPGAGGRPSNGWDRVWRFLNRRAALAALDRRAMLKRRAGGYALTGVFGHTDFALAGSPGVALDDRTIIGGSGPDMTVENIGGVTLDVDDRDATPGRMALRGLPATSDLTGVTGRLTRGKEEIEVVAGCAAIDYRPHSGFKDQFGLMLAGSNVTPSLMIKRMHDDAAGGRDAMLVTLSEPLVLDPATSLSFHCTDVPLRDGGAASVLCDFRQRADLASLANSAGLDTNHLAGFRWSLYRGDAPGRPIVVQGLRFEPLELCQMTLRQGAAIATIQICGRLLLPLHAGPDQTPPPVPEGLAMLNIDCPATGPCTLGLALQEPGLRWPLADPATFPGMAPVLHLPQLPAIDGETQATLHYRFGATDSDASLMLKRHADGGFSGILAGPSTPGTGEGMEFAALSIALAGADVARPHAVTIRYRLRLGKPGARISGECVLDLLGGGTALNNLDYAFSEQAGERMPIEVSVQAAGDGGKGTRDASFDARHLALCWTSTAGRECGVLGGLRAVAGAGTLMATLAPAGDDAIAGYTVGQLDARARFTLKAAGAGAESELALVLDTAGGEPTYSLAGALAVNNVFSWPALEIKEAGAWQTARFPAAPAQTFSHAATLRFDGQRLAAAALAGGQGIALMVEVSNTVTRSAADGTPAKACRWRAFQTVRLAPICRFMESLEAAALPSSTTALKNGDTAYSPLVAKQARPLIHFQAARHVLHRGAANAGGLSGALAGQMAALLKNAPPALAIDLSNHVLLAFGDGLNAADKLRAALVLTSMPGLAFVTPCPDSAVLPTEPADPLRRALACRAGDERTLYLAATDGYASHRFPPLEARLASLAAARLQRAFAARPAGGPDLATLLAGDDAGADRGADRGAHEAVFQAVVFREQPGGNALLASSDYPAAATAFHLSAMFSAETDGAPLAIGFGGGGRIAVADMFGADAGLQDGFIAPGTRFDAEVYRREIGCFRDWATRNVLPGPDLLPQATPREPAPLTMQLDARTRQGGAIATIGKLALPAHALEGAGWEEAQRWAMRLLQRAAPWAAEGMLTVRATGFGLDAGARTMLVRVEAQDYRRPERSERLPAPPLPAQPQFEARAAKRDPAAGLLAGYRPLRVAPAAFLSGSSGADAEPRLAANGVTLSWALDTGSGAILEAGPGTCTQGPFDDFWIADRERIAVRPSTPAPAQPAARPYDLTFALPDGYQAALPRALAPAAYPVRLAPDRRDGEFVQAYAPARVSTSRIAARAGAWTSTRAGLAQSPSAPDQAIARASETPVHLRQPRPAPLARNDRTRPSSHEADRHLALGARQVCVVHGPRAAPPGADLDRIGLNRAPRSRWATALALAEPAGSIIGPDWDGAIVVEVECWLGTSADDAAWTIRSAALLHGTHRYAAGAPPGAIGKGVPSLRLDAFTRVLDGATLTAREQLGTLQELADLTLELNLTCSEEGIGRQLRFHLYAGASPGAGIEMPLFFRFEDPEFNDRLGGLAKLKRRASTLAPADEFILAADVAELRPSQRIDLALALRAKLAGGTPKPFAVADGKLTYDGKVVHLLLERLRNQQAAALPLAAAAPDAVGNAIGDGGIGFFLRATDSPSQPVFHALAIDCGSLRGGTLPEAARDAGPDAALAPGDQLRVTVMAYDTPVPDPKADQELVSLLLDVVADPNLPANPSAFAILHLQVAEQAGRQQGRVGVHVYANAPEPSGIEIVDPRDLVHGVVRRRAVYHWRSFAYLDPAASHHFALQKINAIGASWLPEKIAGGWQPAPNRREN